MDIFRNTATAYKIYRKKGLNNLLYHAIARLFGDEVQINNQELRINSPDKLGTIDQIIHTESPTIVDAGAAINAGDNWIENFIEAFDNPKIHAIEPRPSAAKILRHKYSQNDRVIIHECAIGAEIKQVQINVADESGSSSIYSPKNIDQRDNKYEQINKTVEVQQVTLDELINEPIDVLKLDIEGYEMEALKGGAQSLITADVIISEIQFTPHYDGAVPADELIQFLRKNNFYLHNLYDLSIWNNGQLAHADGIFINKKQSMCGNNI